MKGIILAGGTGTRLYPITKSISKQILPVYDKPMIYYPLSVLMLTNIHDILIISTERDLPFFEELLGDGSAYGIKLSYAVQDKPRGLADAFIVGEQFIGKDSTALILGDNVFYGRQFSNLLQKAASLQEGALIFGYYIPEPKDFGVVEFDAGMRIISIEEKPEKPKSDYAIPGLYFYDNKVVDFAKHIKPSPRGELEITAINNEYLKRGELKLELFGRGMAWLDTGTHQGLLEAAEFVSIVQKRQGLYISCIEEIAYRKGYISKDQLKTLAQPMSKTDYGKYLLRIAKERT